MAICLSHNLHISAHDVFQIIEQNFSSIILISYQTHDSSSGVNRYCNAWAYRVEDAGCGIRKTVAEQPSVLAANFLNKYRIVTCKEWHSVPMHIDIHYPDTSLQHITVYVL